MASDCFVSYTLFHLLTFVLIFLSAGAFSFVLLSAFVVVQVLFRLFLFVYFVQSCAGLHCLLFGSEATVVCVSISCGVPGGNEQMAHSHIAVVICIIDF